MACKSCASENQQGFRAELSINFPGMKGVGLAPVYLSTKLLVCLNCGHAELAIPVRELERLKKGVDASRSAGA